MQTRHLADSLKLQNRDAQAKPDEDSMNADRTNIPSYLNSSTSKSNMPDYFNSSNNKEADKRVRQAFNYLLFGIGYFERAFLLQIKDGNHLYQAPT